MNQNGKKSYRFLVKFGPNLSMIDRRERPKERSYESISSSVQRSERRLNMDDSESKKSTYEMVRRSE